MDSRTLLDHALFQLTPTRTRCDLVVYAGGVSEKLASGLLQPFVQHLKTANDQISRGGYSVTLRPQINNSSWFTKATLQRFVRFVSSPEVLERFVTIEREIEQIESSVQSNEQSIADAEGNAVQNSTSTYKSKQEHNREDDSVPEENSKVRLQRALGTRKAVLRREQAMAYARALVTGFEMDAVNDLISFADAFGALRLREACISFKDLCKKKNQDRFWVDEIAAVQASRLELPGLTNSGIILAGEENQPNIFFGGKQNGSIDASVSDSATSHGSNGNQDGSLPTADGKIQVPMPWANHIPQYMHNFQGPVFQQMHPYQAYPFPGMQVPSPYFPGNMQWPPNVDDSGPWRNEDHTRKKSSSRKKKPNGLENSNEEDATESSDTDSESISDESSQKGKKQSSVKQSRSKKHGKKSSRKVVIRNINYITSRKEGEETSDDEEDFIDGEALKQHVEEAVGTLERRHKSGSSHHKKSNRSGKDGLSIASDQEQNNALVNNPEKEKLNDQWGAFQTLLMRDNNQDSSETEPYSLQVQEEYFNANSSKGNPKAFDLESEKVMKQRAISSDSFIATNRETSNGGESQVKIFEASEDNQLVIKKRDSTYEELLFSQRTGLGNDDRGTVDDYSSESRIIKRQSEGDWFVGTQKEKAVNKDKGMDLKMFSEDYASSLSVEDLHVSKSKKDVLVDDSFIIQARSPIDDQIDSLLRTDLMVPDIVEAAQYESGTLEVSQKPKVICNYEPDDLYMVLGRDSTTEHTTSWMPEISYENDILSVEANRKNSLSAAEDQLPSDGKSNKSDVNGKLGKKVTGKDARLKVLSGTLTRSKSEIMSGAKKPSPGGRTMVQKGKSDKEEERRRRMEELSLQRQKRIAERSSGGSSMPISRKTPVERRSTMASTKNEKPNALSTNQDTKKIVFRSSTIDRLATARTTPKEPPAQSKSAQTKKSTMKANGVSQNTTGANKKLNSDAVKSDDNRQKKSTKTTTEKPADLAATQVTEPKESTDEFKDIKELHSIESIEKTEGNKIVNGDALDNKSCNGGSLQIDSSTHVEKSKVNNEDLSTPAPVPICSYSIKTSDHPPEDISEELVHPMPESPHKASRVVNQCLQADSEICQHLDSQKILEIEESTPPPDETNPELVHARKKWNTDENSPKAAKGFRKLLLFGKKS